MTMLYPQEDGKLVEIPEEHAAVLALYRERMPVVFEVQEYGQPMLYPLIDVDAEPPAPRSRAIWSTRRSPLPGICAAAASDWTRRCPTSSGSPTPRCGPT